jgi:hypothetical protein
VVYTLHLSDRVEAPNQVNRHFVPSSAVQTKEDKKLFSQVTST